MRLLLAPEKIPVFSEILLVAGLAWVVSGWLLPANAPKSPASPLTTNSSSIELPDLADLINVPLFGNIQKQTQAAMLVPPPKAIVISPLNIKLLGTVVATDHAAAIIAPTKGGEQRVYFIGDSIQPGVILKTVEAEAIVVKRGGKLERIYLEQNKKLTSSPLSPAPTPNKNAIARSHLLPQTIQKSMNRKQLQQRLQNFPALLSQARVTPHMVNGQPNGFTISEIAPGSLYQQAGLQNGDIILSVNGKRITDAKQAMSMYQTLQRAAAIDLELMRASRIQKIHYVIR